MLETLTELAPTPADAFLVVDGDLSVEAISRQAEELLNVRERSVVRRPLTELLIPADPGRNAARSLLAAVSEAASGAAGARPSYVMLRIARNHAVRLGARVGRCGPPLAALIVLELTEVDRLDLALGH